MPPPTSVSPPESAAEVREVTRHGGPGAGGTGLASGLLWYSGVVQ